MTNQESFFHKLTFSALIVLAIGIFTSVSFSALSHVLLLISGVYFTTKWLKVKDLPVKKSWWALLSVAIVCIFSVISNWNEIDNPIKNIIKVKYFIVALLSYFSFGYFKRDFLNHKKTALILRLFLVATTIATISGLIALYTGFNPIKMKNACHDTRACGLYGMYMTYGYGISLFMVLITGMLFNKKMFNKWVPSWLIYAAFSINMIGLVLSYARGAWLGYFLAVPFYFFKDNTKKFFAVVGSVAVIVSIVWTVSPAVRDTFTKRMDSNNQRLAFYASALTVLKDKPLLGYGYRNFEPNVKKIKAKYDIAFPTFGSHAHNNVLEHLGSTGIIGAVLLVIFFGLWLGEAYQKGWLFSFVISFLISGMVQYTFGDGENLFLILAVFSLF
jgi:O-antigen ligase